MIGEKLGSFNIEGILGSGAMGVVYRATHEPTGRPAAVKVILNEQAAKASVFERFEREAKILQQFKHNNIVRFYAVGRYQGRSYIAMEFIKGQTLDQALESKKEIPWQEVVKLGAQLCDALHYAHERGVVHRDLKPSNLIITEDRKIKLADFGIAKDLDATALTDPGKTIGTAAYMAPEQIRGTPEVSHKTDLYALGVVLYQMLAGDTPFKGKTTVLLMHAHMNEEPPRVSDRVHDVPRALDELITQLMAKDPVDRPWDAGFVGMKLNELLEKLERKEHIELVWPEEQLTINPERVTTKVKTRKKTNQQNWIQTLEGHKVETGLLVLALVTIVGFLGYMLWPASVGYLYTQAEHLMASDKRADWRQARDEYIDPLEARFPDHPFKEQLQNWKDKLDRADAESRAQFLDTGGVGGMPKDEVERAYKEAATRLKEDLSKYDEVGIALLYRDLAERLAKLEDPKARGYRLMSEARAADVEQTIARRRKDADDALILITAADTTNAPEQALKMRREFVDKYSRYPYLQEQVEVIRKGLTPPTASAQPGNEGVSSEK